MHEGAQRELWAALRFVVLVVTNIVWQTSKMLIALERKGDLKRLRVKGIIGTCDWLFFNDRCLLLSSANDGKGRCVLLR